MLFASDMPFDPVQGQFIRDTIADVDELRLTDEERAQIYEGNARRLLLGQPRRPRALAEVRRSSYRW